MYDCTDNIKSALELCSVRRTPIYWLTGDCFISVPHGTSEKPVSKGQLPPDAAEPSRVIASPGLMLHSSLRSCSHFKRTLIPCSMYDSWWVCSKAFRFIIKWMKQCLCESKLIQMCAGVSCCLCLQQTRNLVGSGGNLLVLQKWKHAGSILWALIYDGVNSVVNLYLTIPTAIVNIYCCLQIVHSVLPSTQEVKNVSS